MRYIALACDYDGTLAARGQVGQTVIDALKKVSASGRKLIMVTGREIDDLMRVFPEYHIFDRIVAENGALLYCPEAKKEKLICEPASEELFRLLEHKKVTPLSIGRGIIATWEPNETVVLESIHELGLELHVIFNKGAVMILPSGMNKGAGLLAALHDLRLSRHNCVGVGDAENDHAFLSLCELSVAVDNALPSIKERADLVTQKARGEGVIELIEKMIEDDLASVSPVRDRIVFAKQADGDTVEFDPYDTTMLIAGLSGGGKSRTTLGILESMSEAGYQFCVFDPEGDYEAFDSAIVLGNAERAPILDEVMQVLKDPTRSAIINLLAVPLEDRPNVFDEYMTHVLHMRNATAHPHLIVLDEAHHLLPSEWQKTKDLVPPDVGSLLMITVHPERVHPHLLKNVNLLVTVGQAVDKTIGEFARQAGIAEPRIAWSDLESGQGVVWFVKEEEPLLVDLKRSSSERRRHRRKYAEGELPEHRSFYFTGPKRKLNLRVQNLTLFNQIAEGVDDETWLFHLKNHDVSKWFKEVIKDDELYKLASRLERDGEVKPKESRSLIKKAIEERYTSAA